MFKRSLSLAILTALLVSLASVAQAQGPSSDNFIATNGDWGTASNWNSGILPGSATDAFVGGPGGYTCNFTTGDTDTVNQLFVGTNSGITTSPLGPGFFDMSGGTLTVTSTASFCVELGQGNTVGPLLLTNGQINAVGFTSIGDASSPLHIDGAGSLFNSTSTMGMSSSSGGAYCVSGGGRITCSADFAPGNLTGCSIETDVLSTISAGTLGGSSTSYVRLVCGASPTAGSTYTPITASTWDTNVYQGIGGYWNQTSAGGGTHLFTASNVVSGTLGSQATIYTSANQRAKWTDPSGNSLGASFLYSSSTTTTVTPTVTALPSNIAPPLAPGQFLEGDWGVSGVTVSRANPVYLSLSAPSGATSTMLYYSSNGGTTWAQITNGDVPPGAGYATASDLTFNGAYYSFDLTGTGTLNQGYNGFGFSSGYDYAVVCTVPEPASLLSLAAALAGLAAYAWRKRQRV